MVRVATAGTSRSRTSRVLHFAMTEPFAIGGEVKGMSKTRPLIRRFLDKVSMPPGHAGADKCFEWIGARDVNGYGKFRVMPGMTASAHRLAYEMARGPIPQGSVLLHTCDNPVCVRVTHLRAGTQSDNIRDMHAKGRARPGGKYKSHCRRGHPFDEENTRYDALGRRTCRACGRYKTKKSRSLAKRGMSGLTTAQATHCRNGHKYTPVNTGTWSNGSRCCKKCKRAEMKRGRRVRRSAGLTKATQPAKGVSPCYPSSLRN
jgi:hypothetical protein